MNEIIAFHWRVPACGFEWIEADSEEGKPNSYLVVRSAPPTAIPFRSYNPLEETGLFRIFGEIAPTHEGVLEFAQRYGLLASDPTRRESPSVIVDRPKAAGSFWKVTGETLDVWTIEHHAIRETIALWDAVKGKADGNYGKHGTPTEYLSSVVRWSESATVSYTRPVPNASRFRELHRIWKKDKTTQSSEKLALFESRFQIVSESDSELFKRFTPGDLFLPAQYALQRIVRSKLREHLSKVDLLWDWKLRNPELRIHLVPSSLIAAIWLQFATAIDGGRDYRRCEACKKWFEVSARARGDAKFCKQSCRFRAYRQRQQRARELSATGVTAREIAVMIDSDINTVKGWLLK